MFLSLSVGAVLVETPASGVLKIRQVELVLPKFSSVSLSLHFLHRNQSLRHQKKRKKKIKILRKRNGKFKRKRSSRRVIVPSLKKSGIYGNFIHFFR